MATVEELIKQELSYAKKEYDKVTEKLERLDVREAFEGEKEELVGERKELKERRDRWEAQVQSERKELKERRDRWETQVQKLQDALAAIVAPTGRSKRPRSPSGSDDTSKRRREYIESFPPGLLSSQGVPAMSVQGFPYKCDYQSLENNTTVHFKYKVQPIPNKLLFLAETDKGSKKCIKFTRRYSKDVHLSCASQGYAPALRGFEALPGEWYMVVMDMADINVYKPYSIRNTTSSSANFPSVVALRPKVEEIIKHLHRNGLVHGDVRDSNLLVRTDDEVGCMLVDFDWAGKEGEVHYPINVNRSDIRRPDGARDGLPIKREHDLEMISIMFDPRTATRALSFMDEE